jgi:hypothetical protein
MPALLKIYSSPEPFMRYPITPRKFIHRCNPPIPGITLEQYYIESDKEASYRQSKQEATGFTCSFTYSI